MTTDSQRCFWRRAMGVIISPPKNAHLVETVCIPFKKRLQKQECSTRPTRSRARAVRTNTCRSILLDIATAMMGGLRQHMREGGGRAGSAQKLVFEGVGVYYLFSRTKPPGNHAFRYDVHISCFAAPYLICHTLLLWAWPGTQARELHR